MTTEIKQPRRLFNVDEYHAMGKAGILGQGGYELIRGVVCLKGVGKPRQFSVGDYYAMAEAGIISHDERVELINGEIVAMTPIGDVHAYCVDEAVYLFTTQLGERARVRSQNPVRLADNREFQPDVSILRWREDKYLSGHPMAGDVLLLIEVSDYSLDYDRNEKLPLYAEAEIREAWIVNIPERVVEVNTDPAGGVYRSVRVFGPGDTISPMAFPDISLSVDQVIPG